MIKTRTTVKSFKNEEILMGAMIMIAPMMAIKIIIMMILSCLKQYQYSQHPHLVGCIEY